MPSAQPAVAVRARSASAERARAIRASSRRVVGEVGRGEHVLRRVGADREPVAVAVVARSRQSRSGLCARR